jgi:hypothetical protein
MRLPSCRRTPRPWLPRIVCWLLLPIVFLLHSADSLAEIALTRPDVQRALAPDTPAHAVGRTQQPAILPAFSTVKEDPPRHELAGKAHLQLAHTGGVSSCDTPNPRPHLPHGDDASHLGFHASCATAMLPNISALLAMLALLGVTLLAILRLHASQSPALRPGARGCVDGLRFRRPRAGVALLALVCVLRQ